MDFGSFQRRETKIGLLGNIKLTLCSRMSLSVAHLYRLDPLVRRKDVLTPLSTTIFYIKKLHSEVITKRLDFIAC